MCTLLLALLIVWHSGSARYRLASCALRLLLLCLGHREPCQVHGWLRALSPAAVPAVCFFIACLMVMLALCALCVLLCLQSTEPCGWPWVDCFFRT